MASGYAAWCRLPDDAADDSAEQSAWEEVHRLVWKDSGEAADILMQVLDILTPTEVEALVSLGADALEDLLRDDPTRWMPIFTAIAQQNDRAAVAMSAVWLDAPWDSELSDLRQQTGQPARG